MAIIGAGGIGIDVAHYLTTKSSIGDDVSGFMNQYQILEPREALEVGQPLKRKITVFQRSSDKIGKRLGKTTGWAHLQSLRSHEVKLYNGAEYLRIDDKGLHVKVSLEKGEAPQDQLFEVDQIIIAAGQEPFEDLSSRFNGKGMPIHVIGGARETSGLDAKVAIREGAELAARL